MRNLEVHIYDMIVKSTDYKNHYEDMEDILRSSMKYNMSLNLVWNLFLEGTYVGHDVGPTGPTC